MFNASCSCSDVCFTYICSGDSFLCVTDKRVCGYTIYKKHSELPFRVDLVNNQTGAARVVLKDGYKLDYERRHKYKFEIAPHDCVTGKHANR